MNRAANVLSSGTAWTAGPPCFTDSHEALRTMIIDIKAGRRTTQRS